MDKSYKTVYSGCIIHQSTHSNYSAQNQRDLVLDTAENLTQIGRWTLNSFAKERQRIELFLKLTRKNLNALAGFPLSPSFDLGFKKFCQSFARLEKEYSTGIVDRTIWANGMLKWGSTLIQSSEFI